ncbi:CCC motif membrane protein [Tamlana sp. 2_MG-2023]|uniref:CCC motif membrane protein n=1 Tax=unclassified Tamlana TaxID=2614803 RepID=UPI0026E2188A|nr:MULTISPECIES: CCC motif membrane protein [unclassified Tamlana]MDO6761549.1 CCC motif membrane protein [Tamlana sp. 2_MG-2023]MDO6792321.1 CCC motif membrane protein [Tamlana sp. 1_MG-2023]
MEQQKLPNSTLILVFGILSIPFCGCYGFISIILGVVAIILASKASKIYAENPEMYTGYQNVKVGKILAIIGVVLGILFMAFIAWMVSYFGMEALQDEDLMREKMQELLGE